MAKSAGWRSYRRQNDAEYGNCEGVEELFSGSRMQERVTAAQLDVLSTMMAHAAISRAVVAAGS